MKMASTNSVMLHGIRFDLHGVNTALLQEAENIGQHPFMLLSKPCKSFLRRKAIVPHVESLISLNPHKPREEAWHPADGISPDNWMKGTYRLKPEVCDEIRILLKYGR